MTAPRHRSLNLAQTLDELLGTGKGVDGGWLLTSSSSTVLFSRETVTQLGCKTSYKTWERLSFCWKQQRREQGEYDECSNEESNQEPSSNTPSSGLQTMRIHDPIQIEHEADDFLSKL